MIKHLKGCKMSNKVCECEVFVKLLVGTKIQCMKYHMKPIICYFIHRFKSHESSQRSGTYFKIHSGLRLHVKEQFR